MLRKESIIGLLSSKLALLTVLLGALFLRLCGLKYGLPLTIVADEPPFTLGALQMIQLKTLLPSLHPEAFKVLYYAPYLSYLYLLPFTFILGVKFLMWHGSTAIFPDYLLSDLSVFFETARFINVIFGTASVYFLYKTAESFYNSKFVAFGSAFLLATSLNHIGASMIGRHWAPTTFFFSLILFILTRRDIPETRRYFMCMIAAGIGIGFDTAVVLSSILVFWWFASFGEIKFKELFRDKFILSGAGLFFILAALPTLLHWGGNGFLPDTTLFREKSFWALITAPFTVFSYIVLSEPVFFIFTIAGFVLAGLKWRRFSVWGLASFLSYILVFYIVFRLEPRFFQPLLPMYALFAGYAFSKIEKLPTVVILTSLIILFLPLVNSIRLSELAIAGDTRSSSREWVIDNLKPEDKIITYVSLTHLPVSQDSLDELRKIDMSADRKTYRAEASFGIKNVPYALNLYTIADNLSFQKLPAHAKQFGYKYFLYEPGFGLHPKEREEGIFGLLKTASPVVAWKGSGDFSVSDTFFTGPFWRLYTVSMLGPNVELYKLNQDNI